MQFIYIYLVALVVFAALDFVWLRLIAKNLYRSYIGHLLGPVNWVGAFVFYVLFMLGLVFFAINPAVTAGAFWYAVVLGSLYGFFTYSTYDFTNYATLRGWPLALTIIDIVWGVVLSGVTAGLTFWIV